MNCPDPESHLDLLSLPVLVSAKSSWTSVPLLLWGLVVKLSLVPMRPDYVVTFLIALFPCSPLWYFYPYSKHTCKHWLKATQERLQSFPPKEPDTPAIDWDLVLNNGFSFSSLDPGPTLLPMSCALSWDPWLASLPHQGLFSPLKLFSVILISSSQSRSFLS